MDRGGRAAGSWPSNIAGRASGWVRTRCGSIHSACEAWVSSFEAGGTPRSGACSYSVGQRGRVCRAWATSRTAHRQPWPQLDPSGFPSPRLPGAYLDPRPPAGWRKCWVRPASCCSEIARGDGWLRRPDRAIAPRTSSTPRSLSRRPRSQASEHASAGLPSPAGDGSSEPADGRLWARPSARAEDGSSRSW